MDLVIFLTGNLPSISCLPYISAKWGWNLQGRGQGRLKTYVFNVIWLIISAKTVISVIWYLSNEGVCSLMVMILTCHISRTVCWQCRFLRNVWEQCIVILSGRSSLCWTWDIKGIIWCAFSTLNHLLYHFMYPDYPFFLYLW